jgi:hypothetical protein
MFFRMGASAGKEKSCYEKKDMDYRSSAGGSAYSRSPGILSA